MLFPAKQSICPNAHTNLCLVTNPSGGVGRMGQIYMGRENPFGELVAVLTADEFLLLRKAVDERRCRDEVGVGKLAENAVAYLPDPEY